MTDMTMKIEGMSCQHCVMRVKKAIDSLSGVSRSEVAVGSATITYDERTLKPQEVKAAIEKAGYKVQA